MSAIRLGDAAFAMLPAFKRKVARALALLDSVMSERRAGVSFSTGKDSSVVLDLARRVNPAVPAAYFSSGQETEYDENFLLLAEHYPDVDIIESEQSLADLCRWHGYWGHEAEKFDAEVDWFAFVVGEPSVRFVQKYNLDTTVMGLRAQESSGRRMSSRIKGEFYTVKNRYFDDVQHHHCTPIVHWTDEDVWAYIASRNLPYNAIYDRMAEIGLPRPQWRVSILMSETVDWTGGFSALKQIAPDKFNALAVHFPKLRRAL